MSNQEIFEMLSNIECEIYYKCDSMSGTDKGYEDMLSALVAAQRALEAFAKATGCHN